ncbi:MAG: peptidase M15 [Melioribacteraceae bacterium]|nr:MAG: peptidase M15 [Melioribacteraceae bacterium]
MKKIILVILFSLLFSACASQTELISTGMSENKVELISSIDSVFSDDMFSHAFWGAKVVTAADGEVLYQRNADKLFMPASNEKIITTSAALRILGPEFRFLSKMDYSGKIENGILTGDLILYSNGDPTLYTRFFDSPLHLFKIYANALSELGIRRINGNIVGDDTAFEDEHLGYGWAYDGLPYWYSAPYGALQVNENYVDIIVTPGKNAGDPVTLFPNVNSDYFNYINNITTVDSVYHPFNYNKSQCNNEILFSGELKAGSRSFEISPTVNDPTLFYLSLFRETLLEHGISLEGGMFDIREYDLYEPRKNLVLYESPALREIASGLMKRSQNLYAETFARVTAWYRTGLGNMRTARNIVYDNLAEFGLEKGSYRFMDGSGLSRYNYVSPNHLVKILKGMYDSELKDIWLDIQPIAGVDGTLRRRMKNTSAEGNVRAKTGTISNVRGLSGYVTDKDGNDYIFSFLVNAHLRSSRDTEIITDKVCELLADFSENGKK